LLKNKLKKIDAETFKNVATWLEYVRNERDDEAKVVLVGNKIDCEE